jgi:hypothetical protein|eukprot:COSAG06_NODE_10826_length_1610_cov_4.656519_2_plen_91_part_00
MWSQPHHFYRKAMAAAAVCRSGHYQAVRVGCSNTVVHLQLYLLGTYVRLVGLYRLDHLEPYVHVHLVPTCTAAVARSLELQPYSYVRLIL